jgi:O-acetyl-ADP-ribose deacetylase (regulator of RNase III)
MSVQPIIHIFPGGQKLELIQGDLTEQNVDAIVNAANEYLIHGGGVAAAIVHKGGEVIQEESNAWVEEHGAVSHDLPAYTHAGSLPCRYVIHAVGPVWGSEEEENKLSQAIRSSLELAEKLELVSIAFPPISTGIFGYPKDKAAVVFLDTIQDYFRQKSQSKISLVRLVIIDQPTYQVFTKKFKNCFPNI